MRAGGQPDQVVGAGVASTGWPVSASATGTEARIGIERPSTCSLRPALQSISNRSAGAERGQAPAHAL